MILAMMVVYVIVLHLVFNVFKWVTPNTRNKIYVTVAGLFGIYCILLFINVFQPMSTDLRVYRYVVPISPAVAGPVVEVPVEDNERVKSGAVLFQIDPVPYEAAVENLEAQLALARIRLEESRQLFERRAGTRYEMESYEAQVKQLEANLKSARFNLEHTTVRAPAAGHPNDVALKPGQVVAPGVPVLSFVNEESHVIAATFRQEIINRIKVGQEAEIALDSLPGRTLAATVSGIDPEIPQGQVVPSGQLVASTRAPHGFMFVHFALEEANLDLSTGMAGAATVYTDGGRALAGVRKVFFRWYTWLNFVITDMDIRGLRQR